MSETTQGRALPTAKMSISFDAAARKMADAFDIKFSRVCQTNRVLCEAKSQFGLAPGRGSRSNCLTIKHAVGMTLALVDGSPVKADSSSAMLAGCRYSSEFGTKVPYLQGPIVHGRVLTNQSFKVPSTLIADLCWVISELATDDDGSYFERLSQSGFDVDFTLCPIIVATIHCGGKGFDYTNPSSPEGSTPTAVWRSARLPLAYFKVMASMFGAVRREISDGTKHLNEAAA